MRKIHSAAMNGNNAEIEVILASSDAEINSTDIIFGDTPLICACRFRHLATVKLLLDRQANPSIVTQTGSTALHAAIHELKSSSSPSEREDLYTIIRLLLEKDLNLINLPAYKGCKTTVLDNIKKYREIHANISKIVKEITTAPSPHLIEEAPVLLIEGENTPLLSNSNLKHRNPTRQSTTKSAVPISLTPLSPYSWFQKTSPAHQQNNPTQDSDQLPPSPRLKNV